MTDTALLHALTLAADDPTKRSLLDYIREGHVVSYLLVFLSFVAVGLMIASVIQLRRDYLAPPDVVRRLDEILRSGDTDAALTYCTQPDNDCLLTRMFAAAIGRCSRSAFGFLELRSALEESGQRQLDRLSRVTDGIGLIAALGPMLGLLGTVFGMIGAFSSIGHLEGAARSNELATYMSIALITTAEGLIVAIPCTAVFTICKRRVERLGGEVGELVENLASHLQGRAAKPAPAARPVAIARSAS